jgi:hypothetical protein
VLKAARGPKPVRASGLCPSHGEVIEMAQATPILHPPAPTVTIRDAPGV